MVPHFGVAGSSVKEEAAEGGGGAAPVRPEDGTGQLWGAERSDSQAPRQPGPPLPDHAKVPAFV